MSFCMHGKPFYCLCKISQPFAQFVKKLDLRKFTNTMVFWGKKSPKFDQLFFLSTDVQSSYTYILNGSAKNCN